MSSDQDVKIIRIAAAVIVNSAGNLLLVRKRGTRFFMQPGGKIEPLESPHSALIRECLEEISLRFEEDSLVYLGRFQAPAANEKKHLVDAEIFKVVFDGDVRPNQEIDEVKWWDFRKKQSQLNIAPLTSRFIIPMLLNS